MYYLGKPTESFPCDLSAKIKKLELALYTVLEKKFMSQLFVYIIGNLWVKNLVIFRSVWNHSDPRNVRISTNKLQRDTLFGRTVNTTGSKINHLGWTKDEFNCTFLIWFSVFSKGPSINYVISELVIFEITVSYVISKCPFGVFVLTKNPTK